MQQRLALPTQAKPTIRPSQEDSKRSVMEILVFTNTRLPRASYDLIAIRESLRKIAPMFKTTDFKVSEFNAVRDLELMEKMRICALPAVMVGNQQIIGIPNEDALREAIRRASS